MIQVRVEQLFLSNMGFVVLLGGEADKRSLPIFIGAAEAQAIALHINKVDMPRPLTHDLLKNVLDFLECRLKRVEICDLRDGTFYARLVLDRDTIEMEQDARPSDALALALRCGAPIFVHEPVMEQAGRVFSKNEKGTEEKPDAGKDAKPAPVDMLREKLAKAVAEERYEDAARLRDEIARLTDSNAHN